jgi:hypothetical protein
MERRKRQYSGISVCSFHQWLELSDCWIEGMSWAEVKAEYRAALQLCLYLILI